MRTAVFLLALFAFLTGAAADALAGVGVRRLEDGHRGAMPLGITVFYPATGGGRLTMFGRNAVFEGVRVQENAPLAEGTFPVLILSHGGLRAGPDSAAWLAARLAQAGYVVAYPSASRILGARTFAAGEEIWRRADDLSAALTALQADPRFKGRLAENRIGAVGFQLGGTAALQVAGAQFDPARLAASCDAGGTSIDCAWFKRHGIDLHKLDAATLAKSRADKRFKAVAVVDPEYGTAFRPESLQAITLPVALIALGTPGKASPAFGIADLARSIKQDNQFSVPNATNFDTFDICRPKGPNILKDEGENEGLCATHATARRSIHQRLQQDLTGFFRRTLAAQ